MAGIDINLKMPPVNHPLHGECSEVALYWVLESPTRRAALNMRDVVDGQRKFLRDQPMAVSVNALAITPDRHFVMLEISRAKSVQLWDFGVITEVATGG